jgi:predicted amidohydrolase
MLVFPELSITGYTCGGFVCSNSVVEAAADALFEISEATREYEIAFAIGCLLF